MRFASSFAGLVAAAAFVAAQTPLFINTPSQLFQCQPVLLTWGGGEAPYYVRVVPGGQPTATPLATLQSAVDATTYSWRPALDVGTEITLLVSDNRGQSQGSAPVTIMAGDTSCLNQASSSSASSSASSTSASSSSSAAPSSSSTSASSTTSSSTTSSSSSSSTTTSSSSTTSMSPSSTSSQMTSTSASGTMGSAAASPTSGAGSLKAGSALALVAGAFAIAL
ncbi:uncharacterized protein JCM10292_007146 [Rhodotorula paludigena]|uniref:uncharacterized protein n=1 Tax=Rhodotorula paludigena TaxID=86838 RepID=UPI00317CA2C8